MYCGASFTSRPFIFSTLVNKKGITPLNVSFKKELERTSPKLNPTRLSGKILAFVVTGVVAAMHPARARILLLTLFPILLLVLFYYVAVYFYNIVG